MASISLTGQDAVQINGRNLNDLADGDSVTLTYPNDIAALKSSKNGNVIYAFNETGKQCEVALRLLLGSADDKFLNSLLSTMKSDFSKFVLLTGIFVKRVGDGAGNLNNVIYQCSGGIFKKQVEAKTNAEGNTDQSVVIYTIVFGQGIKAIQ